MCGVDVTPKLIRLKDIHLQESGARCGYSKSMKSNEKMESEVFAPQYKKTNHQHKHKKTGSMFEPRRRRSRKATAEHTEGQGHQHRGEVIIFKDQIFIV